MSEQHPMDERYGLSFGQCEAVGTTFETVWTGGGLYNWRTESAPLFMASTEAADVGMEYRATGIRGAEWATPYQSYLVDVALNGQTPVALDPGAGLTADNAFLKAGYPAPAGTVRIFAGTATAGVPDDSTLILAQLASSNTALQCVATAPAGRMISFTALAAGSSRFIQWALAWRSPDAAGNYGAFLLGPAAEQDNATTIVPFDIPICPGARAPDGSMDVDSYLGPGSQVEIRAKTDTGTKRVTAFMIFKRLSHPPAP